MALIHKRTGQSLPVVTQDDNTDIVRLQVEGHTLDSGVELNHLTSLDLSKTEHTCNTITDGDDGTEFLKIVLNKVNVSVKFIEFVDGRT